MKDNKCLCGEQKYTSLFESKGYEIVKCQACGQVRTLTPSSLEHKQLYQKDDLKVYIDKEQLFRKIFSKLIKFVKTYQSNGVLVDIGAGSGLLMSEASNAGFDTYGYEPSKAAVAIAKKHFGVHLSSKKFSAKEFGKKADVIVINHVLEHIENPKEFLGEISSALNTNGLLVIGVPNFGSIMSGLKKSKWQSLIPDQHRWHFTFITLNQLLISFGFAKIAGYTENHDRSMHYWWKRPFYWVVDQAALQIDDGEAFLFVYQKT